MCQCQACAAGEALNRGLASLAVRSLLSLSPFLSKFFSPSWDGDKHKLRVPTLCWHSGSFEATLCSPMVFFFSSSAVLLRCISTLKWIHPVWTSEGGVIRLAPRSPLTLSQDFKAVGGWRFESCSQNSFCVGLSLCFQLSDSLPINLLHS